MLVAAVALTGLIFLLQGLGVPIGRGFMVGDPTWALVGAIVIIAAGAVTWWDLRRP